MMFVPLFKASVTLAAKRRLARTPSQKFTLDESPIRVIT